MTLQKSLFDYQSPPQAETFEFTPAQEAIFQALDDIESAILKVARAAETADAHDRARLQSIRDWLLKPLHELYDVYLIEVPEPQP